MGAYRSKLLDETDIKGRISRSSDHDFLEEVRTALRHQIKPAALDAELDRMARASGDFLAPDGGPLPKALRPGSGGYTEKTLLGAVGAAIGIDPKTLALEQVRAIALARYRKAPSPVRDARQALRLLENQRGPLRAARAEAERQAAEQDAWVNTVELQLRAMRDEHERLAATARQKAEEETSLEEQFHAAKKTLEVLAAGDEVLEQRELEALGARDEERARLDAERDAQNAAIEADRLAVQSAQRQAEQAAAAAEVEELRKLGAKALKEARR